MLFLDKKFNLHLKIKPNESGKKVERVVETALEDKEYDSYPKAIAKSFLGLPVSENHGNIYENMMRHITNDNRKLFIPVVYESARKDRIGFTGYVKHGDFTKVKSPADFYLENANVTNIQNLIEKRKYYYENTLSIGNKLKYKDYISEVCDGEIYFYNHRTKKIYGFDESTFDITTEGMSIEGFVDYCERDYRKIVQEFFNQFPDVIENLKTVKEQTSYLTGKKIDTVSELFTVNGFNSYIKSLIESTNIEKKYSTPKININILNVNHRIASKRIEGMKFGSVYPVNEYYVTPMTDLNGKVLYEMCVIMTNDETNGLDYVPLHINGKESMELNKSKFTVKESVYDSFDNNFDADGILTKSAVDRLFSSCVSMESFTDERTIKSLIEYCNFYAGKDDILYEDAVDTARSVAHKVRDIAGKAGGTAHKIGKAAGEITRPLFNKIDKTIEAWKEHKEDESREIVITDSTFTKLKRFFREVLTPTYLAYAIKGPVFAIIAAMVAMYKRTDDKPTKEKIKRELEEELKIVREKIDDAKSDGARQEKYQLMRIESKLEKQIAELKTKNI